MRNLANNLLPETLRQLRKARGLKQVAVAAELDIEQSTYSGYETGKRNPNPEMLYKLANLYGVNIDTLMRVAAKETLENAPLESSLSSSDADELNGYLQFINNPVNTVKYKHLSAKEKELVYCFDQLSDSDQDDFLSFLKIRISKNKT